MNEIIRYVIKMRNGSYMLQDLDDMVAGRVHINSVDHPIDASLFKDKSNAVRCISEILTGNTNLLCLYNDDNPPKEVEELKIKIEVKSC